MLKKDQLEALAKLAKLTPDALTKAITDEKEVDITVPEGEVFAQADIDTLKQNEYKRGTTVGVEIAIKEYKQKNGMDFPGKTLDGLVTAANEKALADAKIEPEKKVKELQEQLKTVQATASEYEGKLKEKDTEIQSAKLNGELIKHVPAGALLEADEVITLMKAKGYEFKSEEGKLVVYKDGHIQQDKLANPLTAETVIKTFTTEKKLISDNGGGDLPGGRGGGGKPPGGGVFSKASEIAAKFKAEGKSLMGEEFSNAINAAQAANKEFEIDSV